MKIITPYITVDLNHINLKEYVWWTCAGSYVGLKDLNGLEMDLKTLWTHDVLSLKIFKCQLIQKCSVFIFRILRIIHY